LTTVLASLISPDNRMEYRYSVKRSIDDNVGHGDGAGLDDG
jgi:hypothetical protein